MRRVLLPLVAVAAATLFAAGPSEASEVRQEECGNHSELSRDYRTATYYFRNCYSKRNIQVMKRVGNRTTLERTVCAAAPRNVYLGSAVIALEPPVTTYYGVDGEDC